MLADERLKLDDKATFQKGCPPRRKILRCILLDIGLRQRGIPLCLNRLLDKADQETGEVFDINSSEISASVIPAIPIIVGFLARFGIKWVVKKFGKKAIKSAVKDLNKQLKKSP
ncbi:SAR2788 family putative toxin [Virgibacillus proomii]|uniref:SAR2788 family putative toxin n=1 Tax=Virgibacillus proomii TaxID=84407 RepID=UPI00098700BE|nr:SAR2788 family putative toxin [Virgibacillus proomii]